MNSTAPADIRTIRDDPAPVWTLKNGSAIPGASILDPLSLQPFDSNRPPVRKSDVTKVFSISQTGIITWVVNGSSYTEPITPVLYGSSSNGWNANTILHLPFNSTIDIIMKIVNNSKDIVSLLHLSWRGYIASEMDNADS